MLGYLSMRGLAGSALVAFGVAASVPASSADATSPLAAHRAVYDLSLQQARGDVSGATGTMAYEVLDTCEGWASRQRLQMVITNRDGQDIEMVSDYTTWESKDGLRLRFRMRQTTETAVTSEVAGEASLDSPGGPGQVRYTVPSVMTKELPAGTLFPMKHTETILAAAANGQKFVGVPLFDGTGDKGAQDSSTVISAWGVPKPSRWPALADLPSGHFRIAFFERDAGSQQPEYEVGMRYWKNGVADDLSMDFGEFVMRGTIGKLELLPHAC